MTTPLATQVLARRKAALLPADAARLAAQLQQQPVPFNTVTPAQVVAGLEQLIRQQRQLAGPLLVALPARANAYQGHWPEAEFHYRRSIDVAGTQFGDVHELQFEFVHIS